MGDWSGTKDLNLHLSRPRRELYQIELVPVGCDDRIRTDDLWIMRPMSYQAALHRETRFQIMTVIRVG